MPKVKIDEKEYELDDLSDDAKAQLASLNFVNNELVRLNATLATYQTARIAYSRALKQLLDKGDTPSDDEVHIEGLGETISFD